MPSVPDDFDDLLRRCTHYGYQMTVVANGVTFAVGPRGKLGTFIAPTLCEAMRAAMAAIEPDGEPAR